MLENVKLRQMDENDKNIVLSSWLRTYKDTSQFAHQIPRQTFYKFHQEVIKRIWDRPTTIKIAMADIIDPVVIYSYLVAEINEHGQVIHYAYTKRDFRQHGLFNAMLSESILDKNEAGYYTHRPREIVMINGEVRRREMEWLFLKLPNFTYNPYLI